MGIVMAMVPANNQRGVLGDMDAINARRAARLGTPNADYLKLDEMGMLGVTHMMMLDRRNLEIADILLGWLARNVRPERGRSRATN